MNDYKCPQCLEPMQMVPGHQLSKLEGYTAICTNLNCPPHENVSGHGNTEKAAYEVACQKFRSNSKIKQ